MSIFKKSIFYKIPQLYTYGLKIIHGENFDKRYLFMASFVKKGDFILEPACGPAILADYLPKGTEYRGFDTNKDFINYALKHRKDVYLGDVLNIKNYQQADIVVACDILHHLKPQDRKRFIQNCYSSAKKVFILCEPGKQENEHYNFLPALRKKINEWAEKDGTIDFKNEYYSTRKQLLKQIKNGFDVIPKKDKRENKEIGEDILAIFFK